MHAYMLVVALPLIAAAAVAAAADEGAAEASEAVVNEAENQTSWFTQNECRWRNVLISK
jgi:hypothetical protein